MADDLNLYDFDREYSTELLNVGENTPSGDIITKNAIPDFELFQELLVVENEKDVTLSTLNNALNRLKTENDGLKETLNATNELCERLKRNISGLYKYAGKELHRQEKTMAELTTKLEACVASFGKQKVDEAVRRRKRLQKESESNVYGQNSFFCNVEENYSWYFKWWQGMRSHRISSVHTNKEKSTVDRIETITKPSSAQLNRDTSSIVAPKLITDDKQTENTARYTAQRRRREQHSRLRDVLAGLPGSTSQSSTVFSHPHSVSNERTTCDSHLPIDKLQVSDRLSSVLPTHPDESVNRKSLRCEPSEESTFKREPTSRSHPETIPQRLRSISKARFARDDGNRRGNNSSLRYNQLHSRYSTQSSLDRARRYRRRDRSDDRDRRYRNNSKHHRRSRSPSSMRCDRRRSPRRSVVAKKYDERHRDHESPRRKSSSNNRRKSSSNNRTSLSEDRPNSRGDKYVSAKNGVNSISGDEEKTTCFEQRRTFESREKEALGSEKTCLLIGNSTGEEGELSSPNRVKVQPTDRTVPTIPIATSDRAISVPMNPCVVASTNTAIVFGESELTQSTETISTCDQLVRSNKSLSEKKDSAMKLVDNEKSENCVLPGNSFNLRNTSEEALTIKSTPAILDLIEKEQQISLFRQESVELVQGFTELVKACKLHSNPCTPIDLIPGGNSLMWAKNTEKSNLVELADHLLNRVIEDIDMGPLKSPCSIEIALINTDDKNGINIDNISAEENIESDEGCSDVNNCLPVFSNLIKETSASDNPFLPEPTPLILSSLNYADEELCEKRLAKKLRKQEKKLRKQEKHQKKLLKSLKKAEKKRIKQEAMKTSEIILSTEDSKPVLKQEKIVINAVIADTGKDDMTNCMSLPLKSSSNDSDGSCEKSDKENSDETPYRTVSEPVLQTTPLSHCPSVRTESATTLPLSSISKDFNFLINNRQSSNFSQNSITMSLLTSVPNMSTMPYQLKHPLKRPSNDRRQGFKRKVPKVTKQSRTFTGVAPATESYQLNQFDKDVDFSDDNLDNVPGRAMCGLLRRYSLKKCSPAKAASCDVKSMNCQNKWNHVQRRVDTSCEPMINGQSNPTEISANDVDISVIGDVAAKVVVDSLTSRCLENETRLIGKNTEPVVTSSVVESRKVEWTTDSLVNADEVYVCKQKVSVITDSVDDLSCGSLSWDEDDIDFGPPSPEIGVNNTRYSSPIKHELADLGKVNASHESKHSFIVNEVSCASIEDGELSN